MGFIKSNQKLFQQDITFRSLPGDVLFYGGHGLSATVKRLTVCVCSHSHFKGWRKQGEEFTNEKVIQLHLLFRDDQIQGSKPGDDGLGVYPRTYCHFNSALSTHDEQWKACPALQVIYIVLISGRSSFQTALTARSETLMPKYAMWSVHEGIVSVWIATSQLLSGNGKMKD